MNKPIHIIITVKPSERYPGKNTALYGFTLLWLYEELNNDSSLLYTITIVGDPNEVPYVPKNVNILETNCNSQYEDIITAANQYDKNDIFILLQLTLPVRQKGLLKKAILAYLDTGVPVISATLQLDNSWRILNENGNWKGNCKDHDKKIPHYDGAIYVWLPDNLKDIFDKDAQHTVVTLRTSCLVDVDYKGDVPIDIFDKVNETSISNRQRL